LRIKPDYAEAHQNLGNALAEFPARIPEAMSEYEAALRNEPNSAEAHYNFGVALSKIDGRTPEAIAQFQAALRINTDYAEAHSNLGSSCPMLRAVYRKRFPTLKRRFDSGPIMPMRTTIWEPPCRTYRAGCLRRSPTSKRRSA